MIYQSTRFGKFELPDDQILRFPEGLYGFEQETRFALFPFDPKIECPLHWLQSLQSPDLAFVVADPFAYKPDYKFSLTEKEKQLIELAESDTVSILVIVKIPADHTKMTANLIAPLVINNRQRLCRQVVLSTLEYDTRHYLLPDQAREAQSTAV